MSLALAMLLGVLGGLVALVSPAMAADSEFPIVMLALEDDTRYGKKQLFARFQGQALGRPVAGAKVALKEVKFHGAALGIRFSLRVVEEKTMQALAEKVSALHKQGVSFFLSDLPATALSELSQQFSQEKLYFFNVSAADNALRQTQCAANLFHVLPSDSMKADAIVQYLVSKKWKKVLLLRGEHPTDLAKSAAFKRAVKRYGLTLVDERAFVISNDPRERQKNNIALLTGGRYDVIYVADSQGEFAREVSYQGILPRPVVGDEGLVARTWHWAWERHGAPQLEKRFEKKHKRPMADPDWAAWMAVKVIAKAVQVTKTVEPSALVAFLTSDQAVFDGFKGNRLNFRAWNHQLRQPMLLSTHNWVIDRAPMAGFLHQSNNLDTLGFDQREVSCQL